MPYANPEDAKAWARRYYLANRARKIKKAREWAAAHPERRRAQALKHARTPGAKARARARYEAAPDVAKKRATDWARANPVRRRETRNAWWRRNPAYGRLAAQRRRARQRGAFIEDVDPLVVLERDDGVCGICGEDVDPFAFHVDHVIPLARGGEHSYANTQPAHPSCNSRKGGRAWL